MLNGRAVRAMALLRKMARLYILGVDVMEVAICREGSRAQMSTRMKTSRSSDAHDRIALAIALDLEMDVIMNDRKR